MSQILKEHAKNNEMANREVQANKKKVQKLLKEAFLQN